jgi:phytol kinase
MCTLVPLLLFTQTGRAQTLLISLIIGLVAMLLEAVAWRGLDNLFLPLGGYLLLKTHLPMSVATLVSHLLVTVALLVFVLAWRRRTSLNDTAVLGAALYGYSVWSIGGVHWLFAPVFLFVAYPLIWPKTSRDADRVNTISVVGCVGAAGLVWLFIAVAFRVPALVFLYNVAFGAQMAMIGLARLRHRYSHASGALLLPLSVIGSWILLVLPPLLVETPRALLPARAAAAVAALTLSAVAFDRIRRDLRNYPVDPARWQLQAALGMAGSAFGLVPILWGS